MRGYRYGVAAFVSVVVVGFIGPVADAGTTRAAGNEIAINPNGELSGDKTVTLSGTYLCNNNDPARAVFVTVSLMQDGSGRTIGEGERAVCDGQRHSFTASGKVENPPFEAGPARASATLLTLRMTPLSLPGVLTSSGQDVTLVPSP
ncbi:hypothetical protein AOZ06_39410 [Kibdelosporangium phytohabitans]|uniref:DUF6299 domain-containing protein n=2 Tax=Kibdelosporangium phytohabitans TaxID=860235 RepID=A0A0N9I7J3_9PSEU|nr:DUF6299 family protein [Kibdelosporangium phytohabitans]ALG12129.1 hypothetical protein AOZ06_39410 [Kibdelosporangium phytohabitans]